MFFNANTRKAIYPATIVDRPRLYRQLDRWTELRAIAIQAPAGYGKSSLVSRWLDVSGTDARWAWLSLDEAHCDPRELLRGIAEALATLLTSLLPAMQPGLDALQSDPQRMMRKLIAALWDGLVPADGASEARALLVLDDLHVIAGSEAASLLTPLLEKGPPGLHCVLLTRQATSLPLTRLYASGQALELTTADLRFTADEVEQYLLAHRISPAPEELAHIMQRAEGWVVALQLALHSQRMPATLASYLASLRGNKRWLAHYLTEEVLAQQSPGMRTFLLRTSILESFNASLAGAVAGVDDAYRLLAELQHNELFLIPLDTDGAWFRYHHLFGELLSHRLAQVEGKTAIDALHRQAAAWLAKHEQVLPAIRHHLHAGEEDAAATLVEGRIRPAILHNPVRAQQMFDALPPAVVRRRPRLMLERCLISLINANKDLTQHVDNAQQCLAAYPSSEPMQAVYDTELQYYRAAERFAEGDLESATVLAQKAQRRSEHLDQLLSGALEFLCMRLGIVTGDEAYQQSHAMRALAAFRSQAFVLGEIAVRRELAMVDIRAGRSARASRAFEDVALAFGSDPTSPRAEMDWVYAYAAEHSYWQNQLDRAMHYIVASREIASIFQNEEMITALNDLQKLCAARELHSEANEEPTTSMSEISTWYRFVDWRIRWLLADDRIEEGWGVARQYQAGLAVSFASLPYFRTIPYLRANIARGVDLEAAGPLLGDALKGSVRANDLPRQLELLALQAWLELQTGEDDRAQQTLARAEELVAKTGYVRVLLDIPALATRLAAAQPRAGQVGPGSSAQAIGLLSDRERAVLALLAKDLTYPEIGAHMVISINTVRTHVRHIYKKLGVKRRDQAIRRAQALGMLRNEPGAQAPG